MNAKRKKTAIRKWNEKKENITPAHVVRGISIEHDGKPMEPGEIAFISSDDSYTPSGDIRRGSDPCFPPTIDPRDHGGDHRTTVAESIGAPTMKVYNASMLADDHREREQKWAPAPALAAKGFRSAQRT